MATPGSAEESLQLAEHYRRLTDEELIALAQQKQDLTEQAQLALAAEILSRKLTVPKQEPRRSGRPSPPPAPDPVDKDDPYSEDRQLYEIRKVWSEADARRLQYVLDAAGIPFYMGAEKATCVDDVTSDFSEGVPVKVMRIGWWWAYDALYRNYVPQDERPEPSYDDAGDVAIHCPRCRSTDVVFHELVDRTLKATDGSGAKYRWTCGACGNEWVDDGVETQ